jgi:CRP-like cAMP-binding protein
LLLKEGEIEKNLYYIESGAVRVFLLSAHEEQTIRLGYEGSIINSLSSFLKGSPSEFYVEAIRKTTLKVLSKAALSDIVNKNIESLNGYNSFIGNGDCTANGAGD